MTAKDICLIIEAGGRSGLTSCILPGLDLRWSLETPRIEFVERGAPPPAVGTLEVREKSVTEQELVKQAELDELLVRNPAEYERLLQLEMSDEVEDGDSGQ